MTILSFPTLSGVQGLSSSTFGLISNTQIFQASQIDADMTNQLPGYKWAIHLQYDNLSQADFSLLFAWLCQMSGQSGRVFLGPQHAFSRGTPTGTPIVSGAGQNGSVLLTSGWTINTTVLKVGDYFSFPTSRGQELHIVTADVISDGSGVANMFIAPGIRTAPANAAAITVNNPSCIMQLKDDDQAQIIVDPPLIGRMTFDLIEALS